MKVGWKVRQGNQNWMSSGRLVRSIHEIVKHTKMHIIYNDLMPEKLRYPVNLCSLKCRILQLLRCMGSHLVLTAVVSAGEI